MQAKLLDEDLSMWEPPSNVLPAPGEGKMIAITIGGVKLFLRRSLAGGIAWATDEALAHFPRSAIELREQVWRRVAGMSKLSDRLLRDG